MKTVPLADWRSLSDAELEMKVRELAADLYKHRCQARQGTLEKTHQIRLLRRNLARLFTLRAERKRHVRTSA